METPNSSVALMPIQSTEEELRLLRASVRDDLTSLWWLAALLIFSIVVGACAFATNHGYQAILGPLLFAVAIALAVLRFRPLLDARSVEKRFAIQDEGLLIETILNDKPMLKTVVRWKDVLLVTESSDRVELRLRSGGFQYIPNACFMNDEQRRLLVSRAGSSTKPIA